MSNWYQLSSDEAARELATDPERGLDPAQAERRLEETGPNELVESGRKSAWRMLLEQFTSTMVVILIIAAAISAYLGEYTDAIVVMAVVVLNALLGFRQEYQAEEAMAALKKLAVPHVRARRGGHVHEMTSRELVPGDVVLLEAGNLVPADGRLLESANLRIQEAALTGESEPVEKNAQKVYAEERPLADRRNMAYMGTVVAYGRGELLVTETGMKTELGGIASLMQSAGSEPTPLQKRLDRLGKQLALGAGVLVLIVFILGYFRGEELRTLLLTAIGMSVAAVPEGLPAVVTVALALGAQRMLKRRALIRKLPAVEALGSVTVICSDKTGTLTENRMTVTILDVANHRVDLTDEHDFPAFRSESLRCEPGMIDPAQMDVLRQHPGLTLLLAGGALCNDALLECDEARPGRFSIVGDPTEGALVAAAARTGMDKDELEAIFPRIAELPFDSDRKRMTTVHRFSPDGARSLGDLEQGLFGLMEKLVDQIETSDEGTPGNQLAIVVFTKGATDGLLQVCDRVWMEDHLEPLDDGWRERVEDANASLAGQGMRVLAIACRTLPEHAPVEAGEHLESRLALIGLAAMIDPARPEVKDAVQTCRDAGIRPMMITGDHPLTARYIANELGISANGQVITGQELERMGAQDLIEAVEHTNVFARVSPEHKLRIVEALKSRGNIVAMTGDGVNDAPALKQADIGVAMGITGTDVSKEAADMVLLDDNFATIVAAVEEGRTIYDNIRKFIKYTMTSNLGEIWVMLLSPFLGMPLALLPLQILWINLVTDGLPGLALGVEKAERNTMHRPPYPPNENIFARGVGRDILIVGLLMGLISLGIGYVYWLRDSVYWQTMIFTTLTLSEMGYVMAIRSNRDSLFAIGPFTNRALIGAVLLTIVLQVAVVYVPFLQNLLGTQSLPLPDLLICFALSTSLFFYVELQKWVLRRTRKEA